MSEQIRKARRRTSSTTLQLDKDPEKETDIRERTRTSSNVSSSSTSSGESRSHAPKLKKGDDESESEENEDKDDDKSESDSDAKSESEANEPKLPETKSSLEPTGSGSDSNSEQVSEQEEISDEEEDRRHSRIRNLYLGMFKVKILVLGPCQSGKTAISNFLADATETSGGDYHPTQGVRILEFEVNGVEVSPGRTANCEIELWDCSGNHKFSTCWPAFQKDTNGVVLVYNPDQLNHDKELETWFTQFVQMQGLKDSQCVIFAHHKPDASDRMKSQPSAALSRVPSYQTNLDEEPESLREDFSNFLAKVISNWTDKRDQEELSIMNHSPR